jgi:hypothetical protein
VVSPRPSPARPAAPAGSLRQRRCAGLLDALRQYREKIDDKRQISLGPLHDWTSHYADAFRYLAVALKEQQPARKPADAEIHWMS